MGKDKLRRFNIIDKLPNVLQCDDYFERTLTLHSGKKVNMQGKWNEFFKNSNPICLELACGKGHYTVGLGRLFPEINYIGLDIKGARFFVGAQTASEEELHNVAFLRTHIEHIESFFSPSEISEIWISFPDPQKEARREKKRLTHQRYLEAYARLLQPDGKVHLKTDSDSLFEFSCNVLDNLNITPEICVDDIDKWEGYNDILAIRTDYEMKHRALGSTIKYLRFSFPKEFKIRAESTPSAFHIPTH